jgi:hypothetical protein
LHLFCEFTTPPKEKYLVLAAINPALLFIVINSEINDFKRNSPDLLESQIELKKDTHPFMLHDSWIDCSKVIRDFDAAEVFSQFKSRLGGLKGSLSISVRQAIRAAVADSRTLERRFKESVLAELTDG